MDGRRLAGAVVSYGALALSIASACYGVAVFGLVAAGTVDLAAVLFAGASLGFALFAAATGWFVLRATRGQVLPLDVDRSAIESVFKGGQGG